MPADRGDTGGGLPGEQQPTAEELSKEEKARSRTSVAELVEQDLDDPATPSRRTANGDPEAGSFDVPLEELGSEVNHGR
jgi:hypothetical protein